MIREICKDEAFLAQKAEPAAEEDLCVAQDLLETLKAHQESCVGMAANMIGINKRIIAFENDGAYMTMFNPQIVRQSGPYEAEEGCLSLTGTRKTRRWSSIKVQYQNEKFQIRFKTFTGWTAEIIQHEIDHWKGSLYDRYHRQPNLQAKLSAHLLATELSERICAGICELNRESGLAFAFVEDAGEAFRSVHKSYGLFSGVRSVIALKARKICRTWPRKPAITASA